MLAEAATGDPGRVRKAGRRLRREEDRRAADARKVRRAHQQRTLSFRADEAARTMWVEGRLPLIDGVKVRAAVDGLAAPDGTTVMTETAEQARTRHATHPLTIGSETSALPLRSRPASVRERHGGKTGRT